MFKIGLLLGFTAVLLQIAVFLQPLLPKQYQIAPVCETIAQTFDLSALQHHKAMSHADSHMQHMPSMLEKAQSAPAHDHHDLNHQCQYCTVYGHLILPPELDVKRNTGSHSSAFAGVSASISTRLLRASTSIFTASRSGTACICINHASLRGFIPRMFFWPNTHKTYQA